MCQQICKWSDRADSTPRLTGRPFLPPTSLLPPPSPQAHGGAAPAFFLRLRLVVVFVGEVLHLRRHGLQAQQPGVQRHAQVAKCAAMLFNVVYVIRPLYGNTHVLLKGGSNYSDICDGEAWPFRLFFSFCARHVSPPVLPAPVPAAAALTAIKAAVANSYNTDAIFSTWTGTGEWARPGSV